MNTKINKRPKNKYLAKKQKPLKGNKKSIEPKKSLKSSEELNGKEEVSDDLDNDLKHELNEIIKDFKKTDNKNQKLKNKKLSDKTSTNRTSNKTQKELQNSENETKNEKNFFDSKAKPNLKIGFDSSEPKKSRSKRKLLVRTETKWYEMRVFDDTLDLSSEKPKYSLQRIQELRGEAQELLRNDIEVYTELQGNHSSKREDFEWIRTVLRNGTLGDKLSAHTVLLQDSAIHNLKSLEQLISMVNTKGKRECIMALDQLRDLFVGDLLIPDKKLKIFSDLIQHFDDKNRDKKSRSRQLVLCLFEDQLKTLYRLFLDSVVKVSHDSVETTKHKSLITFFDLLVNNGEQEQYLLQNLCNKLGDPLPKLAAQSTHLLNQLINQYHPQMKSVVVEEVERLLYRPNIAQRAQYYALCFLSEVIFDADDRSLANRLIKIYFGFFKACIKKGDINNKMMSVLLTGVTRAFPYSKLETNVLEDHLHTFYKVIHFVSLNTSIQALLLIFNIIDVNQSGALTDRFYSVLYRHIQDTQLENCSRKAMFLNLVYRAMKRDPILRRVRAFVKRLLQIALTQSTSLAASILILISEVIKSKPGLMLAKEVKEVSNVCADDEDDEEKYEDLPLSDEETADKPTGTEEQSEEPKPTGVSWHHNRNVGTNRTKTQNYDPMARNPLFAGAEAENIWELDLMDKHYHPSSQLFAEKILNNEPIDYSGDPINDFSLKHFFDRFVFRNPKKIDGKSSNRSKSGKVFGRIPVPTDDKHGSVEVTSKQYVKQSEKKIPIDERFIYHFLKQKLESKTDGYDSDAESVTSVEFESLLDRLEPMSKRDRNMDFAKDLYKEKNNKKKPQKGDEEEDNDEESDDESDDEFDGDGDQEDDDIDFDADDPEFADAFGGVDSELEDAFDGVGEEGLDQLANRPKKRKQGFDRMTNDLFASADEFAQLLEANEADSDMSGAEEDGGGEIDFKVKRKLGRNYKKKKLNKNDLDL